MISKNKLHKCFSCPLTNQTLVVISILNIIITIHNIVTINIGKQYKGLSYIKQCKRFWCVKVIIRSNYLEE